MKLKNNHRFNSYDFITKSACAILCLFSCLMFLGINDAYSAKMNLRQTKQKINNLKILERKEMNKLNRNQMKLENAEQELALLKKKEESPELAELIDAQIEAIRQGNLREMCALCGNVLEDVTIPAHPEIAALK